MGLDIRLLFVPKQFTVVIDQEALTIMPKLPGQTKQVSQD